MTNHLEASALAVAITLFVSCSGKNDTTTPSVDWTAGRGTAACREWQRAYCELSAKCGGMALATCAAQAQQIACSSDTTASNCASALDAASCSAVPTSCEPTDLVDTAPAIQGCNAILTDWCNHNTKCGSTMPLDTCMSEQLATTNCNNAIGLALSFDTCVATITAAACTAAFPSACEEMVLLR